MRGLDPAFNYEVVDSSGIDFPEQVYKPVKAIAGKVLPVLTINAYVPGADESVEISGVYTVKALAFINASSSGNVGIEDFFKDRNGVLVTKRFADAHHIKQGIPCARPSTAGSTVSGSLTSLTRHYFRGTGYSWTSETFRSFLERPAFLLGSILSLMRRPRRR
jgi:hypothetical protein